MKKVLLSSVAVLAFCVFVVMLGCEKTLIGLYGDNLPPEVWLSSGPVEGDTTGYQVHFYWGGWDPDGEVKEYEFVIAAGNPWGFDRADTTGLDKWRSTASHDSVFRVSADDRSRKVFVGGKPRYTRYDMTHTFFLRAVDLEGKRSSAVYRSFTAWTLAPYVVIDRPPLPVGQLSMLGRTITFGWMGRDPVDSPDNLQDPDSIRWWWKKYDPKYNFVDSLNSPSRYTVDWKTKWISASLYKFLLFTRYSSNIFLSFLITIHILLIPEATSSMMVCSMMGIRPRGNISFGTAIVRGLILEP